MDEQRLVEYLEHRIRNIMNEHRGETHAPQAHDVTRMHPKEAIASINYDPLAEHGVKPLS